MQRNEERDARKEGRAARSFSLEDVPLKPGTIQNRVLTIMEGDLIELDKLVVRLLTNVEEEA